jgi:hypothetical protein
MNYLDLALIVELGNAADCYHKEVIVYQMRVALVQNIVVFLKRAIIYYMGSVVKMAPIYKE